MIKKCKFCSEEIQDLASFCKHCGKPQKRRWAGTLILIFLALWILWNLAKHIGQEEGPTTTNSFFNQPIVGVQLSEERKQKMRSWVESYGSTFTPISNDLSQVAADASNRNVSALLSDCQQLQTDITTAQNEPPIPSNSVEQHYSSALSYLGSSAQDCVQGIDNNDANQLQQAINEVSQGSTQIDEATQALKQYA